MIRLRYKKFSLLIVLLLGFWNFSITQEDKEMQLVELLNDLRRANTNEAINQANEEFFKTLNKVIKQNWAFDYPFSQLKTLGKITSKDNEVRIFSWNVEWENNSHTYFAFVLKKNKRGGGHSVTYLKDNSHIFNPYPTDMIDENQWYGALYYDIIDVQKGKRTYYTLLGYDAKNDRSTVKLLDVLFFSGNNVKLGYPLFETDEGIAKRVFFEHAAKTVMTLRYDTERQMIVFDHLSPESPSLAEFREYYVPDMSYDGYRFENNKWRLHEDIIANNPVDNKDKLVLRKYDNEKDTIVEVHVKNSWIDPTDKSAPVEGNVHKAALPDDDNKKVKQEKELVSKKQKEPKKKGVETVTYGNLPNTPKKGKKKKKRR